MNVAQELERLNNLRLEGAIDEYEYQDLKSRIISGDLSDGDQATGSMGSKAVKDWCSYIHFSQLLSFLLPLAGVIAPIVLWQMKKDESPQIDDHGRAAVNWVLSSLIYTIVSVLLCLIVIGIPLLIAMIILSIVFPIIAGIKANDGVLWPYPLAIRFF